MTLARVKPFFGESCLGPNALRSSLMELARVKPSPLVSHGNLDRMLFAQVDTTGACEAFLRFETKSVQLAGVVP